MKKRVVEFTEKESEEIIEALKGKHAGHVFKRLMAMKLKAIDGLGNREIGKLVGMDTSSVNRIHHRMKREGIEAIVGKRHQGGHRYMSNEEEVLFLKAFEEQGESGRLIEVSAIHKAYEEAVGHRVTKSAIYYLLHKHNWRKVMPRSRHPKKASATEIQAYQKNIGCSPKGSPKSEELAGDVSGRGWIWTNQ